VAAGGGEGEFQALMEDFDRRMAMLRTVVGAGNVRVKRDEVVEEPVQEQEKEQEKEQEQEHEVQEAEGS